MKDYALQELEFLRKQIWELETQLKEVEDEGKRKRAQGDQEGYKTAQKRFKAIGQLIQRFSREYELIKSEYGLSQTDLFLFDRSMESNLELKSKRKEFILQLPFDLKKHSALPGANEKFIGRQKELDHFFEVFARGDHQQLTISGMKGMGGIGKTAIALEVCNVFKSSWSDSPAYPDYITQNGKLSGFFPPGRKFFSDGILWIRFNNEYNNLESFFESIVLQLGLDWKVFESFEEVAFLLSTKDVLVVLDSAEQNLNFFNFIYPRLRKKAPILITSRISLTGIDTYDLNTLSEKDALDLFAMEADYQPGDEFERAEVQDLCRLLGYLPLAIKLAARNFRRAEHRDLPGLLATFSERKQSTMDALSSEEGDISGEGLKHASARACFSISFDQLKEEEQLAFIDASVFNSPFLPEEVEQVLKLENAERLLQKIHFLGLFEFNPDSGRYDFHPLIREFALDISFKKQRFQEVFALKRKYFFDNIDLLTSGNPDDSSFQFALDEVLSIVNHSFEVNDHQWVVDFADRVFYKLGNKKGLLHVAIQLLDKAACSLEAMIGAEDDPEWKRTRQLGRILTHKAIFLDDIGKNEEAFEASERAQELNFQAGDADFYLYNKYFNQALLTKEKFRPWDELLHENFGRMRQALKFDSFYWAGSFARTIGTHIYEHFYFRNSLNLSLANFQKSLIEKKEFRSNFFKGFLDLVDFRIARRDVDKSITEPLSVGIELLKNDELPLLEFNFLHRYIACQLELENYEACKNFLPRLAGIYQKAGGALLLSDLQNLKTRLAIGEGQFQKALEEVQALKDDSDKWLFLSEIYLGLGDYPQSREYLEKARSHDPQEPNNVVLGSVLVLLSRLDYHEYGATRLQEIVRQLETGLLTWQLYSVKPSLADARFKTSLIEAFFNSSEEAYIDFTKDLGVSPLSEVPGFFIQDLPDEIIARDGRRMILIPEGRVMVPREGDPVFLGEDFVFHNLTFLASSATDFSGFTGDNYLYPFYIDADSVTQEEFRRFSEESGYEFDFSRKFSLRLEDIKAYAAYYKKKIPLEIEWMKAYQGINFDSVSHFPFPSEAQQKKLRLLDLLSAQTVSPSWEPDDIFSFLAGEELVEFLALLKKIEASSQSGRINLADYSDRLKALISREADRLPPASFTPIHEGELYCPDWLPLYRLIAYSIALGSVKKKEFLFKRLPHLSDAQLRRLYSVLLEEAFSRYFVLKKDEKLRVFYETQKNFWTLFLRILLGLEHSFSIPYSEKLEPVISSPGIGQERIALKYSGSFRERERFLIENNSFEAFRCVIPIFSRKDLDFITSSEKPADQ